MEIIELKTKFMLPRIIVWFIMWVVQQKKLKKKSEMGYMIRSLGLGRIEELIKVYK